MSRGEQRSLSLFVVHNDVKLQVLIRLDIIFSQVGVYTLKKDIIWGSRLPSLDAGSIEANEEEYSETLMKVRALSL